MKTKKVKKTRRVKERELTPEEIKLYEPFGGKKWYDLCKEKCCNFDIREKEGRCLTLAEPYVLFRCACSDCKLGKMLMKKYGIVEEEVNAIPNAG